MRLFLLGLLLVTSGFTLVGAESRLRIGVEQGDHPVSFRDATGRPSGFTADLIGEMDRAGLGETTLVSDYWTNLIAAFRSGRIDALANVALTEDRLAEMDFSISHASVHGIVYSRRDRPAIHTTADFAGKTIAVLQGSVAHLNAAAHGNWGATVRLFSAAQESVDATYRGECDAVLLFYGAEQKYKTNAYDLRREFVDDIVHYFRFAVRKGDTATLRRINDALATVRHNGSFDRLYDQWIGPIEPHPIRLADLRPYAQLIILGALAIVAIIWWQRRMLTRVSGQAQALRESEERFHKLVESAFEGWVVHQDGKIVTVNPSYAAMFGYTMEELIGKPVLDLTPPDAHSAVLAMIHSGRIAPYETVAVTKDGQRIPVEVSGQTCTLDGKPARVAAVRDLRAHKQATADQLVLSKLESTGILAGGLAHDFNNLLAMQVLNLDLALTTERLTPDGIRCLRAAKNATEAAKTLTQQLVTFSRGSSSIRQPTDLVALLEKTVPLTLSGANVRGDIVAAAHLWHVDVDAGQIERVVGNLVLNAREAMTDGGTLMIRAENVTLRSGEIPALPAGDYVRLAIADHGPGIGPEVLPKIFDPYFSTKARGTQKGMGLGLTICHSIIHQHDGALTVESALGLGTTFRIFLPATQKPLAPPTPPAPVSAPRHGRILVMDDEDSLREIVVHALQQHGYTVTGTIDGAAAVEHYSRAQAQGQPFDLVLLDLTVRGGMGGLAALQALRALDPAVKAIVMSGYSNEAVLRDFAAHGFVAALAKPFALETLHATLARFVPAAP